MKSLLKITRTLISDLKFILKEEGLKKTISHIINAISSLAYFIREQKKEQEEFSNWEKECNKILKEILNKERNKLSK